MKKLGKISIDPEKVIKNDELVNLRGGYSGDGCCYCAGHGFILTVTEGECYYECMNAFGVGGFWLC